MKKLLIVAMTLLLTVSDVGMSQGTPSKSKRRRHVSGGGENGWPPNKDSLLYKYTRELSVVDTVEVSEVRLGPSPGGQGNETHVIKSVTINGAAAETFAKVWRVLNSGQGAGCFSPAYMVKFYADHKLLVGSTICFHCRNLTLPVGDTSEIDSFDAVGPTGKNLLTAIQQTLASSR